MSDHKFKLVIWLSLIIIALVVASIDVMMWKINQLNPQNESVVTNIVFNDVWYKISILIFLIPALFSYYFTKSARKSVLVIIAGMILIFFGLEDVFYFAIRGVVIPDELYSLNQLNPNLFTKIGFINYMPRELYWLNDNPCISLFGVPVTPDILFKSTAFALIASFILVML
jgi:hypothetical protein